MNNNTKSRFKQTKQQRIENAKAGFRNRKSTFPKVGASQRSKSV